jgi:thiamine pyrophosphokinase
VDHQEQSDTVVVVAAGPGATRPAVAIPDGATVVAADGGIDRALALGLDVAIAVGDFDSVSPQGLAAVTQRGARIERHATDKDATDLELALDLAASLAPHRILVLGSDGGRLDHLLSILLLLTASRFAQIELDAELGAARVHVVRRERELTGEVGELITLLAVDGPAARVSTEGLRFPLRGETLEPGSSRGVSNVFVAPLGRITLEGGVLVAIRPGETENQRWGTE